MYYLMIGSSSTSILYIIHDIFMIYTMPYIWLANKNMYYKFSHIFSRCNKNR